MAKSENLQMKSRSELESTLVQLRTTLMQLRFDLADTKVKDFSKIGKTKREIARVLTALRNATS